MHPDDEDSPDFITPPEHEVLAFDLTKIAEIIKCPICWQRNGGNMHFHGSDTAEEPLYHCNSCGGFITAEDYLTATFPFTMSIQ